MHKIIFFPDHFSKKKDKKIRVPTLPKFSEPLPETHLFSYLAFFVASFHSYHKWFGDMLF